MTDIKNITEFIEHYKNGQRLFVDLEFENNSAYGNTLDLNDFKRIFDFEK